MVDILQKIRVLPSDVLPAFVVRLTLVLRSMLAVPALLWPFQWAGFPQVPANLSIGVTRCMGSVLYRGFYCVDSGPFGPEVCRIRYTDFRERLFHALG